MIEFTTWIEIPIHVYAEFYKATGDGWNEPRVPAHCEIEDIEIDDNTRDFKSATWENLKDHLLKTFDQEFREEVWERKD